MYDCILSTSKSINDDNSILDCRIDGLQNKSPDLVIIDRFLKLKKDLKIFSKLKGRKVIIITTSKTKKKSPFLKRKNYNFHIKSLNQKIRFYLIVQKVEEFL